MHLILGELKSVKLKTFLIVLCATWIFGWLYTYLFVEKYVFHNISKRSVVTQKQCLDDFLFIFHKHKIPVILFDFDILPELFQARPKSWHRSMHKCKTLCKYHPEEKNVITFAIKNSKFEGKDEVVINDFKLQGYFVHLSLDVDPRLLALDGSISYLPTYLWIAKNNHVIHVAVLHERLGSYFWIGPVRDADWLETVESLSPALSEGWQSMQKIGAKFPTYAQAFDISQRFLGLPLEIDGHKINVPYFIKSFLNEYRQSQFIECNHEKARKFKQTYESSLTNEEKMFKQQAKQLILKAKDVLDGINVPFWLSSGTCLGWYRQCDIIPYSIDVDFGVFIHDYSLKLIESMHENGLSLVHKFGKADDSLELSFIGTENIKLDIFFFYKENDYFWNGGTQAHDGQKYKYKFPKFDLCWTEFLQIKIRVPCNPKTYIEANYGKKWMMPVRNWQWNADPPNLEINGFWNKSEQEIAIQLFEKIEPQNSKKTNYIHKIDQPEDLQAHLNVLKEKNVIKAFRKRDES